MLGLTQERHNKDFIAALMTDLLPELNFAHKLKAQDPNSEGLDLLRERYREDVLCPRLAEYKKASRELRDVYDVIHSQMLEILYP